MYTLYTAATPNGHKVSILLEELGLTYQVQTIDLRAQAQKKPEFLALNPNGRIPVLVDHAAGDFPIMESGAILVYLAQKHGGFLGAPSDALAQSRVMQWLMFQMAGVGPMQGQAGFFNRFATEKVPFAIERYTREARRLYEVLDAQLARTPFLAGKDYSIADIATFPWVRLADFSGVDASGLVHLQRWVESIAARPAVQRGLAIPG